MKPRPKFKAGTVVAYVWKGFSGKLYTSYGLIKSRALASGNMYWLTMPGGGKRLVSRPRHQWFYQITDAANPVAETKIRRLLRSEKCA